MRLKLVTYSISSLLLPLSCAFRFAFISCYVPENSNIRLLRERKRRFGPSPQSEMQQGASNNNPSQRRRRRRKRVVVYQETKTTGEDAKVRRHKRNANGNQFIIEPKATSISPTISKTSSSELLSEIHKKASNNGPSRWRRPRRKRVVDNQPNATSAEDAKVRRHKRNTNGNEFTVKSRDGSVDEGITNATSHKLTVSYTQIYFGGSIRKFTSEQFESFEKNMKEYAKGKNPPADLSVESEVTRQGNLRLRNERPKPLFKAAKMFLQKRKKKLPSQKSQRPARDLLNSNSISTSEESFDNQLDFVYENRMLQDAECMPQNNLSLTIDFNMTWSSDLMTEEELKCYQINYENWMLSQEGSKNTVTSDLNSIGVCANKAMNFKSSDQTLPPATACLTAMPTSVVPAITVPPTFLASSPSPTIISTLSSGTSTLLPTIINSSTPTILVSSPSPTALSTSGSTPLPTIMNSSMPTNLVSSPSPTILSASVSPTLSPTITNSSTPTTLVSSPSPTALSTSFSGTSTLSPTIMNSSKPTNLISSPSSAILSTSASPTLSPTITNSSSPTTLVSSPSPTALSTSSSGTSTLSPTIMNSSIPTILVSSRNPTMLSTSISSTLSPTITNSSTPTMLVSSPIPTILSTLSSGTSTLSPTIMNSSIPTNLVSSPSPTILPSSSSGTSTLLPTIMNSSTPTILVSSSSPTIFSTSSGTSTLYSGTFSSFIPKSANDESVDEGTSTLSPTVMDSSMLTDLESPESPSGSPTILNPTENLSETYTTYYSGSFSGSFSYVPTETSVPTN